MNNCQHYTHDDYHTMTGDGMELLTISDSDLIGVIVGPRAWEMKPLETLEEKAQIESDDDAEAAR